MQTILVIDDDESLRDTIVVMLEQEGFRAVQAGDRIEIYRPLLVDPKEVRRLRAAKAALAKQQHP